jgi:hypothetical protein
MSRRQIATTIACLALCAALFAWFVLSNPGPQPPVTVGGSAGGATSVSGSPSSVELIEHPKEWDGKRITFAGEAVSSRMVRGPYAWIHLNDDRYAERSVEDGGPLTGYNSGQAVWVPASLTSGISTYGGYDHQGDVVRVEGVFHAACREHGGDMDIHADVLAIEGPGRQISHHLQLERVIWLLILVPLAGFLWWLQDTVAWKAKTP